jgi:predicted ArsR family transcriptional regulator
MAALAVWDYCEQSVRHVFGGALGDPVADELLRLLRAAPDGMSRWEMSNALGRHVSSDRIGRALALLAEHGLARMAPRQTGGAGRPEERWLAVSRGNR